MTDTVRVVSLHEVLTAVRGVPELRVIGWSDVNRIDLSPAGGVVKGVVGRRLGIFLPSGIGLLLLWLGFVDVVGALSRQGERSDAPAATRAQSCLGHYEAMAGRRE